MTVLAEGAESGRQRPHFLHVFPSFGIGGIPLRMVRVINHFGVALRHTVVALDDDFAAAQHLAANLDVCLLARGRARRGLLAALLDGSAVLRRLRPDLLITYNWGAIEWAMADRLWGGARQMHFEAGFGEEEADRQIPRRVWFRRWALTRCVKVVVPSRRLEDLARRVWKLPAPQVAYIPNGVDVERFADPRDAIPGFTRQPGELVIGTVAPLRREKNIGRLLRVFARLDPSLAARLVIAGEGSERPALMRLAGEFGLGGRVIFTGQVAPEAVLGGFDVFALSSDTEQMPNACSKRWPPVAPSPRSMSAMSKACCAKPTASLSSRATTRLRFAAALARLLRDPAKRMALGRQNRDRVAASFSQARMFTDYSLIFGLNDGR